MNIYQKIFNLNNKIVLITGSRGLLGEKILKTFRKLNAKIIAVDYIKNNKEFNFIRKNRELSFNADMSNTAHVKLITKKIQSHFKKVDVIINAHQIKPEGFLSNKPEDLNEDIWKRIIDVNLTGTFLSCKYFGKLMFKQKKGSIINFGSTYGVVSSNYNLYNKLKFGNPIAYTASKGGISSLTKYLATHWAKKGIRVNCLIPHGVANNHSAQFKKNFEKMSPLGRMMEKDEIIGPIIFLSSDASSYCTGTDFLVEGGWTAC